jgi:hypothetical protein
MFEIFEQVIRYYMLNKAVYEKRKLYQTRLYVQKFQLFLIIKFLQQNLMIPRF